MARTQWDILGEGSYNIAYKSTDGMVLKIQKNKDDTTDSPMRSVRLWNQINPHIPPPASVIDLSDLNLPYSRGLGWVCPFVEGVQANDDEMCQALISIYNNTGRIVLDAVAKNNFIKTPEGQIVCIDIGMALQLEQGEEVEFSSIRQKRKSIVSLDTWKDMEEDYNKPEFGVF